MGKYITISQISETRKKVVKVAVRYYEGGWNTPRCIYLKVQPMELQYSTIDGTEYVTEHWQHGTGYELTIRELTRKNTKLLKSIGEKLTPYVERIVSLFQEGKRNEIKELVNSLAL